jgi:hypothetical protein
MTRATNPESAEGSIKKRKQTRHPYLKAATGGIRIALGHDKLEKEKRSKVKPRAFLRRLPSFRLFISQTQSPRFFAPLYFPGVAYSFPKPRLFISHR